MSERPKWKLVTVDDSSKGFLEDELRMLLNLLARMVRKEIKTAEAQIKRMKP